MQKLLIGQQVRVIMIQKNFNQKKLIEKTGISKTNLNAFLNGWRLLSEKQLKPLAKVLDLDFKSLIEGNVILKSNIKKEEQIELFERK